MNTAINQVTQDRQAAIERHDIDSDLFQRRYASQNMDKYAEAFLYGRHQIIEEIIADLRLLPKGAKVLDVGCGTGHLANVIHGFGFQVKGVEPSQKMLEHARKNFPDIEFVDGISGKLPFADNSFDYIVDVEVFRYLNRIDVNQSYEEMFRVLKPGGRFCATHVNLYASDFYFFYYHLVRFMSLMRGKVYHNCLFTTAATEIKILEPLGFENIKANGRMFGFIRLFYKLGATLGRLLTQAIEKVDKVQNFASGASRAMAGHLIVRGSKPK